jgi:DNA polymerase-3 subunit beta
MKVICSKENLLDGINVVQKAVSSKTTLPILEGILIEAHEKFKLTGNDLEIGIECYIDADIREPGSVVISSKIFGDIIRRLPDSEVLIEVIENNLILIECEKSRFEIRGISPEGFPSLPPIEKENAFRIKQKLVRDLVRQTIFAVSPDDNRPILTGTLIECKNGELAFVSIDGFRLALRKSSVENPQSELSVVVPGKTLNEIVKILQPVDEDIVIYSTSNQILFDMGNCKVLSRLLEGEYLNYQSIIPREYETKVRVKTQELLSGVERASLIISSEERRYPVRFIITDNSVVITANTELGSVREEIAVEMTGDELDIGFNPRYFIDALRVIDDETVEIFFTTDIGPCTVRPIDDNYFAYMVLPVRK